MRRQLVSRCTRTLAGHAIEAGCSSPPAPSARRLATAPRAHPLLRSVRLEQPIPIWSCGRRWRRASPWYLTTGERWEVTDHDELRPPAATACWAAHRLIDWEGTASTIKSRRCTGGSPGTRTRSKRSGTNGSDAIVTKYRPAGSAGTATAPVAGSIRQWLRAQLPTTTQASSSTAFTNGSGSAQL
jgi:hypothetical protein